MFSDVSEILKILMFNKENKKIIKTKPLTAQRG